MWNKCHLVLYDLFLCRDLSHYNIYAASVLTLSSHSHTSVLFLSVAAQILPCLISYTQISFNCSELCHFVTVSEIMTHYVLVMTCPTCALLETSSVLPLGSQAHSSQFSTNSCHVRQCPGVVCAPFTHRGAVLI